MIKNFKIFKENYFDIKENNYLDMSEREKLRNHATTYLEEIVPISSEDGFIKCEYDTDDKGILVSFYFEIDTEEDILEVFDKFLKDNNLEEYDQKVLTSQVEIRVFVSKYEIKQYAEIYRTKNKYNL